MAGGHLASENFVSFLHQAREDKAKFKGETRAGSTCSQGINNPPLAKEVTWQI